MYLPTNRIAHTTAFVTPVVEHWLEREIAQWVHPMKDRSDDPSHHERTLLPWEYCGMFDIKTGAENSRFHWGYCREMWWLHCMIFRFTNTAIVSFISIILQISFCPTVTILGLNGCSVQWNTCKASFPWHQSLTGSCVTGLKIACNYIQLLPHVKTRLSSSCDVTLRIEFVC